MGTWAIRAAFLLALVVAGCGGGSEGTGTDASDPGSDPGGDIANPVDASPEAAGDVADTGDPGDPGDPGGDPGDAADVAGDDANPIGDTGGDPGDAADVAATDVPSPGDAAGDPGGTAPLAPTGLVAVAGDAQVSLTWNANAEPDLAGYTLRWGAAPSSLASARDLPSTSTGTTVDGLSNGVVVYFTLEALDDAGRRSPPTEPVVATPEAAVLTTTLGSFELTGYAGTTQVRQGAGPIEVVVHGTHLDRIASARLVGAFDFVVAERAAGSARLTAIVPHAAVLGAKTLAVSGPDGDGTLPDAIEITGIASAKDPALYPDDVTGLGTPARPFLTLSKALSAAGSGDTVLLGASAGAVPYGDGETWPASESDAPNVPAGVTVEGQGGDRGAVLLQGPGVFGTSCALVAAGSATVRNITVQGFGTAVCLSAGTIAGRVGDLALQDVAIADVASGMRVLHAETLVVAGTAVSTLGQSGTGVQTYDVGAVTITDTTVSSGGNGITLDADAPGPSATLQGVTLADSGGWGLAVSSVSLDLADVSILRSGDVGLWLTAAPAAVTLRAGTVLQSNGGTPAWQIRDDRYGGTGTVHLPPGALPGSGATVGVVEGPAQVAGYYVIQNAGNSFTFE